MEFFTIPLVVVLTVGLSTLISIAVALPFALLHSAWESIAAKRRPVRQVPADAPVTPPPPSSFTAKAHLWTASHRWMAPKGSLALDDDGIRFEPSNGRPGSASSIPWSQTAHLRLRPRISWGRLQRGHLTVDVGDGRRVEYMIPRTGYDGLARLLGDRQEITRPPTGRLP